jgi:hypothetical protein
VLLHLTVPLFVSSSSVLLAEELPLTVYWDALERTLTLRLFPPEANARVGIASAATNSEPRRSAAAQSVRASSYLPVRLELAGIGALGTSTASRYTRGTQWPSFRVRVTPANRKTDRTPDRPVKQPSNRRRWRE